MGDLVNSRIKTFIKRLFPEKCIYYYRVMQVMPQYLRTVIKLKHYTNDKIIICSDDETISLITNQRYSLCRFGDGEFQWMLDEGKQYFQDQSDGLKMRLQEVFSSEVENLLIGIPKGVFDSSNCNLQAKMYWEIINRSHMQCIMKMAGNNHKFADASISRPYIDYKSREYSKRKFKELQRIWNKRDLVIVEGSGTKLGIGNDLLDNANSISRIICPPKNAFARIDEIEDAIIRCVDKRNQLVLVALGPTATIIAYDMCKVGYQVVDIGHVDVEYVWYLRRDLYRKPIEGKSVNESGNISFSDTYDCEKKYIDSILTKIL